MKKKISIIQMNVKVGDPDYNYNRVEKLLKDAITEQPDIIVLPETWNIGFFPTDNLETLVDDNGRRTKNIMSNFAKSNNVNIVAGSVGTKKNGSVYNTTYVFDRNGNVVSEYDKVHGFTPSNEHEYFKGGTQISNFELDGIKCSGVICYDVRFPELIRSATIKGVDLFFIPAEWPDIRLKHWVTLNLARAIENQMFLCSVNGCGVAGKTKYAGNSLLIDPWGEEILHLGDSEEIQTGTIDLDIVEGIRNSINVFRDRKPKVYFK